MAFDALYKAATNDKAYLDNMLKAFKLFCYVSLHTLFIRADMLLAFTYAAIWHKATHKICIALSIIL